MIMGHYRADHRYRNDHKQGYNGAEGLLAFWHASCGGSGIPDRTAFDPQALHKWLGFISVYKYVEELDDFVNALEGTLISQITGQDWTGKLASDVDNEFGSTFHDELCGVRRSRSPLIDHVQIYQKDYKSATRVLMPIADKGSQEVDQIFLGLFPDWS
ncbi:PAS domain-containing protein [Nisaea sp.]|uniref:PAS domain-containing protein n=1 Tax=Nisaea sp. TaxID=2024842 RepID=UPI00329A6884